MEKINLTNAEVRERNDASAYTVAVADSYGHQVIDTELTLTEARSAVAEYESVDMANGVEHEYVILDSREDNKIYSLHD